MRYRHISVAIPVLSEYSNMPALLSRLNSQKGVCFDVYICVNNPDTWQTANDAAQCAMYDDNQKTLSFLRDYVAGNFTLHILDRSSGGKGWQGKKHGVGQARKILLETIAAEHDDNELIINLDADTDFDDCYFHMVLERMNEHCNCTALTVPYFHPLSGDDNLDRAVLRYEIYMRYYLISLMESANPYAFTALGSAMVFPLWSYKRVGGMTPLQGGEDFYMIQKLAKTGRIIRYLPTYVRPQGRISGRVPFGTGPAIAKGVDGMAVNYPLYAREGFKNVAATYASFHDLYDGDRETPMSDFLREQTKENDLWGKIRKNFKDRQLFVHSCEEKVDGLRILQYLRTVESRGDEMELRDLCNKHGISMDNDFRFLVSPTASLDRMRRDMFKVEMAMRQQLDNMCK